jgi:hypothetical protein
MSSDKICVCVFLKRRSFLPGSEGTGREREVWGQGGEMAQTMYVYMNK